MSLIKAEHQLQDPASPARADGDLLEPRVRLKSGMTLIELMVTLIIVVITSAVLMTLYRITITSYVRQDARLEQTQNLRAALYLVARDVRMAGNFYNTSDANIRLVQVWVPHMEQEADYTAAGGALPMGGPAGWFKHLGANEDGVRPIFGTDGGIDSPDTLTIIRSEIESNRYLGKLAEDYTVGSLGPIRLNNRLPSANVRNGDMLLISSGNQAVIFPAEELDGTVLTPLNDGRFSPDDNKAFPEGSKIYNLRDVSLITYYLDQANNNLMASFHDTTARDAATSELMPVVVATNIEDFQVHFFLQNQDIIHNPTAPTVMTPEILDGNTVRGVNIGLVARSAYGDNSGDRYTRPSLFNREAADAEPDDHYRSVLVETIELRN